MEAFKIEQFEQEHAVPFPSFRSLSHDECRQWRTRIGRRFGLSDSGTTLDFLCDLTSRQMYYAKANALEENFALLPLLTALGIAPLPEIFLNWYRFDRLDAFQTEDVARYFDDIWYPGPDDIDLFDASVNWVVSIRHDGVVSFIR